MTMHLARGLTTLNTKKRKKKKLTDKQIEEYTVKWRQHNKAMRRKHLHSHQFDTVQDYIAYCRGEYKPKTTPVIAPLRTSTPTVRESDKIPSYTSKNSFAPCLKREPLQYTGERRLVGIATMHKSNMVPVFADDDDKTGKRQATEIAQMRRN
ncbi:MAG: hypothetical protein CMO44_19080 [Verrucomicrobiales bacterium]|nr:hypothetical protein [Verrucomicrobiales bacterium]|tara:strand:- start:557 stop:1012 length:456 start_codon:yes stop_codon:yes gene_type:complete